MAEGNKFNLKILTPDRVFFEGEADMVEMSTPMVISVSIRTMCLPR